MAVPSNARALMTEEPEVECRECGEVFVGERAIRSYTHLIVEGEGADIEFSNICTDCFRSQNGLHGDGGQVVGA